MKKQRGYKQVFTFIMAFFLIFQTAVGALGLTPTAKAADSDEIELKILHTNDIHSGIDPLGKAAAYIESERESVDHSLFLDAGDIFSGNPVVDLEFGKPIIEVLNEMQLDALTIGNHEFDYGQEEFQNRVAESDFPWISANTEVVDESIKIQQPEPYVEFDLEGLSVGVLGLTETPPSTAPAGIVGLEFHDPIETALEYADKADEVDVFIALTHHGYTEDRKLAENVDFFDVIIGGHSHTILNSPQVVNGTPITQAGANGSHVGNLSITVNEGSRDVTNVEGFLQPTSDLTEVHQPTQDIIDYWNDKMDEVLDEVIGYSNTGLSRDGRTVRDAPLGNFWTDAMRDAGDADIALTNNGGIRDSIAPGELTKRDIFTVEPFANEIMLIEMTGEAVQDVIEFSFSRRNSVDLQTSGLHYEILTYDSGNYYEANLTVNGETLDPEATYTVAVADYIGTGGGGYDFVGEIVDEVGLMTEAMISYSEKLTEDGQDIDYSTDEGRISVSVADDAPIEGEVIGETENGLSSENNAKGDSGLGNLYTDSVRSKTEADVAVLNASSISGNIAPGVITDKMIEGLDAFGNEIVVVETNGERLKEVLLEQANYHSGVDVQISGLTYELVEGDETSNRFDEITVFYTDGTKVEDADTFTVGYNDFMHGQGFYNLGDNVVDEEFGKVWESTVEYVTNHDGPIDYVEGERISIEYGEGGEEPGPAPGDALTVAEAIENQGEDAKVAGYIVGHVVSGTSVNFEAPFSNDFNYALADSPDETNLDKMLFVQITTDYRSEFGLESNPQNVGERVLVEGSLEAYHTKPGLRNPVDMQFIEEEVEEPTPQEVSISEARGLDEGELVTVIGVSTTDAGAWGQKGFYVQDDEAGIYVFQSDEDIEKGHEIKVTGLVGSFGGERQITDVQAVEVLGEAEVPTPITLMPGEVGEGNEAKLVNVEYVKVANLESVNDFGTFEFDAVSLRDESSVRVRVDNRTGLEYDDIVFTEGDVLSVTGVSSEFDGTIQLKPRGEIDFVDGFNDKQKHFYNVKSKQIENFENIRNEEVRERQIQNAKDRFWKKIEDAA
ncbi:5'-nucleotidase C-terminal domain-containing protein [Alteribacter populi]|uniref:5'-nucleotidase C-terminal domain-containing protein n=1 Tax=Alteribacter populi TaxID=2011011 RepID=UPI000BBAC487|nr:5'-nucleotidase C-terminal domain-containing protein [Alteribacter populi]